MGGSSQPATTTQVTKTELPAWLEGTTKENIAIADQISKRPYQAYGGQMTAGYTPEQIAAMDYAQQGVGMTTPLYQSAALAANNAANFTPSSVSSQSVSPGSIGYERVGTGQVGFERVNAPSFLTGNVDAYMNPFINSVESAALSRLEGATKQAVNRLGDQARQARAFGGSRQGIAEGVTLGEAARSAGELSANLRSQGFNTASALMQADQQRAMQAALANQAAGMQTGQYNNEAALRAALANQQAGLTSGQINLDANMRAQQANQQASLQAQLANQAAELQGAQLGLSASGQLQNIAQGAQSARQMDAATLESIGAAKQSQQQALLDEAYNRWMEQRNYPIEMLNLRLGATTATPYGQTQTMTGTRTGGGSGNNFLSGLGTAASVGASLATIAGVF